MVGNAIFADYMGTGQIEGPEVKTFLPAKTLLEISFLCEIWDGIFKPAPKSVYWRMNLSTDGIWFLLKFDAFGSAFKEYELRK